MKKYFAIIGGAVLILAVAAVIREFALRSPPDRWPTVERPVTIAIAKGFPSIIPIIAREMHFFEQEGLNARYTPYYADGNETFDAMLAGIADISGPATIPVVLNSFERKDYSIFLTHTVTYRGVKIIARNDRGIEHAEDLKGKRIGCIRGTISHMTLNSLLSYKKILGREVVIRDIAPSRIADAVMSGSVDAIAAWEPLAARAVAGLGDRAIDIPTEKVYRIAVNLAAKNDFIAENNDSLVRVVRAIDRAISFAREHRSDSQKLIAKVLDLDAGTVALVWDDYRHAITLDQELIITMENEAEWAIQLGLKEKKQVPNYLDYLYTGALEQYLPAAITVIK